MRALSADGAFAATSVGAFTYGAGGLPATMVLLAFFVPSIALSRIGRQRKHGLVDIGKGGPRDAWQVFANGGIATACLVAGELTRDPRWTRRLRAAFGGAYAAATADTWGTEIGTLVAGMPRSIVTGRRIANGLSGGVTFGGTCAELAGALWIAGCSASSLPDDRRRFGSVTIAGFAGAVADSVVGATLQELRRCPRCERTCETNPHECGEPTVLIRGIPGVSNDLVNVAATLTGAATAFVLALLDER